VQNGSPFTVSSSPFAVGRSAPPISVRVLRRRQFLFAEGEGCGFEPCRVQKQFTVRSSAVRCSERFDKKGQVNH
jgi:hypothetical protein